MSLRRLRAIARKEWARLVRDPITLAVIIALPVVLLVLYGYGVNFDIQHVPVAFLDRDNSQESRALIGMYRGNPYFTVLPALRDERQIDPLIGRGDARLVIVIPPDFGRLVARGEQAPVQVICDGADSNTATISLGYATGAFLERDSAVARARTDRAVPLDARRQPSVEPRPLVLYNPELSSRRFIVPGLIAIILAMVAGLLTSTAVSGERELGTLETLVCSPLQPAELMIGKLLPYAAISMADMVLIVFFGGLLFGVWPVGSVFLLFALTLLFLPCSLGMGLYFSNIVRTQQLSLLIAFLATVLPAILLSGFAFARQNMVLPVRLIGWLVPATHFLIIVRGIYLKGVGLAVLWPQVLILAAFGLGLITLAAKGFRKRLD
jgi:ABC-2 type transport system permease protein